MSSTIGRFITSFGNNKSTLFSISGVLSNKISQVLIQVILVRILSPQDYSLFYFYYATVTGLSVFIGDSIGLASSRLIATIQIDKEKTIESSLIAGFISSLCTGVFVIIYNHYVARADMNSPLLFFVCGFAMMISLASVLQYITISSGNQAYLARVQLSFSLLLIAGAIFGAYIKSWFGALVALFICVSLSNLALLIGRFKISLNKNNVSERFKNAVLIIKTSLPICGSMALGAPVHVYCISILKNSSHSNPHELGIFGISFVAYTLVSFLPGTLGQFLVPWLLKNSNKDMPAAFRYVKILYAYLGFALLALIYLANFFVLDLFLPNLQDAKNTIFVLSLTGYIAGFIALYSFYLNAANRSARVFASSIYHSLSYVALTMYFVSVLELGALGLACAILASSFGQLLLLIYFKKENAVQS